MGGGGLGPVVKFRGKIWGKVQPSSQNIIWEVLLLQDAKVGKESQFWGHLGVYLKFKGDPDMEVPPWVLNHHRGDPAHQHLFRGRGKYS